VLSYGFIVSTFGGFIDDFVVSSVERTMNNERPAPLKAAEPEILYTQFSLNPFGHRAGHNSRTAYFSSAFGVFAAHKVPAAGPSVFELAGRGDL